MSSIYIHIPFCKKACSYCNFYFSTNKKNEKKIIFCILKEIELQKDFFIKPTIIETIYFGGGTPSILDYKNLKSILNEIYKHFKISKNAEITLEINPDDINIENIEQWKNLGFNRFSVGIQSLFDDDLKYLNRVHDSKQAKNCLELLINNNLNNISADLIFGIPTSTLKKIEYNLSFFSDLKIPHISCYGLTIEPKTLLHNLIKNKKCLPINQNQQADEFLFVMNFLEAKKYEQYEISNFSLDGFRSKHNSSYWNYKSYLGIGPSAHSFNNIYRQKNIANNSNYIDLINKNIIPFEKEILTKKQLYNEYILTQIRKKEGFLIYNLKEQFSLNIYNYFINQLKVIPEEYINLENNNFTLTLKGKLFADWISMKLFI